MPSFSDFIGKAGGSAEQLFLWGVLSQVVQALTGPYMAALAQAMLTEDPNTPLSPAEAAGLVARGLITADHGAGSAAKAGVAASVFTDMVKAASSAPDLGTLVAAMQRRLIPAGSDDPEQLSLYGGLTDAGIRPEWHDVIAKLTVQIPTGPEVMNAWLEGQIGRDEAHRRWLESGSDPTWFQTAYDANGEAPTPVQALELLNRGIIPLHGTGPGATSYEQAFLETVTAMFHGGQLTHDQAATLLMKQGLSQELATAYLAPAHTSTATATEKHLAKTDVLTLYADKIMPRAAAVKALVSLKYTAADAGLLLDLVDLRQTTAQLRAGVTRVRALYQSQKIDAAGATAALHELGITHADAVTLIDTWRITQSHTVKILTPSQIENAVYYDLITETEGMARLMTEGYDEADAWLALSVRLHSPLKTVPRPAAAGVAPPPVLPAPAPTPPPVTG